MGRRHCKPEAEVAGARRGPGGLSNHWHCVLCRPGAEDREGRAALQGS